MVRIFHGLQNPWLPKFNTLNVKQWNALESDQQLSINKLFDWRHVKRRQITYIQLRICICYSLLNSILIITDRVRSTREGYVLTRVCPSVCLSTPRGVTPARSRWGGGTPAKSRWGVPCQGVPLLEGTPPQVPPIEPGWGVLLPEGTPLWVPPSGLAWQGYPPRVPPCQAWPGVVPLPGGTPPRVEYLIRRSRYGSCVHAGGLSCSK